MDSFSDGYCRDPEIMKISSILIKLAIVFVGVAAFITYIRSRRVPEHLIYIDGHADKEFELVKDVFKENFARGWERDGSSISVYYKGKKVVDIWGGYADLQSERRWKKDTMNVAFSSTKAVAGLCVALLVDRGHARYNQKVVEFWPEFGKHGKDKITLEMVMGHTAGLAHLDEIFTFEDARNPKRMSEIIENQVPHWSPGEKLGYHAVAFGWIVDQVVRRIDPKGRGVGKFFKEEIADLHDIDFHIGLPLELSHRVSRLSMTTHWQRFDELLTDPHAINITHVVKDILTGGLLSKMGTNPYWMQSIFRMTINNPDIYTLEQPAVLGIGTARALAKLFHLVLEGKILSKETLQKIARPSVIDYDIVIGITISRGHGFTYINEQRGNHSFNMVGHAGLGGQNVRFDLENEFSFGYLSNGLKNGLGNTARTYICLKEAIYDSIIKIREKEQAQVG
ncbi:hypothetical protein FO519_001848 [Halicephalobus sp. NKZ332]|nr:hypothetical protein FO519_001848 [Halicephalobus sp. NKZ332]